MALIEEELGAKIDDLFESISVEPVAAASLGQVYKAKMKQRGGKQKHQQQLGLGKEKERFVAVKVQRPGIATNIEKDMALLRILFEYVDESGLLQITQKLVPLLDEFTAKLFGELDYVREGTNAEQFARDYSYIDNTLNDINRMNFNSTSTTSLLKVKKSSAHFDSRSMVKVPKIYWSHTSTKVLTMEWIDGVKLSDDIGLRNAGLDPIDFIDIGIECTLRQLLDKGYFHADPHPGNLLAMKNGQVGWK